MGGGDFIHATMHLKKLKTRTIFEQLVDTLTTRSSKSSSLKIEIPICVNRAFVN